VLLVSDRASFFLDSFHSFAHSIKHCFQVQSSIASKFIIDPLSTHSNNHSFNLSSAIQVVLDQSLEVLLVVPLLKV
jgi:hypothetical protein